MSTSGFSTPSRGRRRLALGTVAVVTVGLAGAYASVIGAQTASDPIRTEIVSIDDDGIPQALPDGVVSATSDTGGVVAYETTPPPPADAADDPAGEGNTGAPFADRRVWIRDRIDGTSLPVAELGSVAPGVSGDGCVVAYVVVVADDARLTVVDRCAAPVGSPLPIGTVIGDAPVGAGVPEGDDPGVPGVAPPALSFDGSAVVWSTGREIRRYAQPLTGGTHVLTETFDVVTGGSSDVATGTQVDVSADGGTVVFLAGPGATPFAPAPANVYLWTQPTEPTEPTEPEPLSVTPTGAAAPTDSASPTISADGAFVVFESTGAGLAAVGSAQVVTPFVVGVDAIARTAQVLVDDASSPTVSADGNHVVYRRGDAVRVLSSLPTGTVDQAIDELVDARPSGALAISQFGRWIFFASTADLSSATVPAAPFPPSDTARRAVWAVDRASSNPEVVDTTTTTTTTTTTVPTTTAPTQPPPPTTVAVPPAVTVPAVGSPTTLPANTSAPTPIVPRFGSNTGAFPRVTIPPAPRRPVTTSSTGGRVGPSFGPAPDVDAFASPVSFAPTVIDAGRRIEPVTLTNATSQSLQVTAVSIDLPDVFGVAGEGCTGLSLAPGASCVVEVQFSPNALGPVTAALSFQLADGSVVVAVLDGVGVPEPTLDAVPAVAGAGQTVTVFGAGFPPGSTVELWQPGSSTSEPVVVDVDGTFAHVVVVLPNTPTGPAVLSVSGQPDTFDDVTAELLVSSRGATSTDAALRGRLGGGLGR